MAEFAAFGPDSVVSNRLPKYGLLVKGLPIVNMSTRRTGDYVRTSYCMPIGKDGVLVDEIFARKHFYKGAHLFAIDRDGDSTPLGNGDMLVYRGMSRYSVVSDCNGRIRLRHIEYLGVL